MRRSPAFTYLHAPKIHRIIKGCRMARRLSRLMRKPCIHYYHNETKKHVIAYWVNKPTGSYRGRLMDLCVWDSTKELPPSVTEVRYRALNQKASLDKLARALEARTKAKRQSRIDQMEARKDFGKHLKQSLIKQGIHHDAGVEGFLSGKRGFVPTTAEEREQFEHVRNNLNIGGTKPSALVNGIKGKTDAG